MKYLVSLMAIAFALNLNAQKIAKADIVGVYHIFRVTENGVDVVYAPTENDAINFSVAKMRAELQAYTPEDSAKAVFEGKMVYSMMHQTSFEFTANGDAIATAGDGAPDVIKWEFDADKQAINLISPDGKVDVIQAKLVDGKVVLTRIEPTDNSSVEMRKD
jgi:hypothetical protein